jgi:uncharacterized membrane protein
MKKITKKQIILIAVGLVIVAIGAVIYFINYSSQLSVTPVEFLNSKQTVGEKGGYVVVVGRFDLFTSLTIPCNCCQ